LPLKRGIDLIVSIIILIVSLPLWLAIAFISRLDSLGPVFYRQKRMGKDGQEFLMWKFRTMVPEAEKIQKKLPNQADGCLFKMDDDPRLTRLGKFLRKSGLDELPQLINVLKGEMSLVGPRPLPTTDLDPKILAHQNPIKHHWQERLKILPGITGYWQVYELNKLSFTQMLIDDRYYLEHWSIWLDLKIIFKTFKVKSKEALAWLVRRN
jgi:lipopolysaccharide/colanic/teichoic acid biosynthesis glycosyltransferase